MTRLHLANVPAFIGKTDRQPPGRSTVLDGLRGWASLSVVCYHIFNETFIVVMPGFRNPITCFLFDGSMAVSIFFILSGEALSAAFFAGRGKPSVVRLAVKRYPRLTIPILAICLITFALFQADLLYNVEAGQIVGRPDWIGSWLRFPFSIGYVLRYSLFSVYVYNDSSTALNAFLWTMRLEMVGSIIVFAVLLTFGRFRLAWPMLGGLTLLTGLLTPTHDLACFTIGIAIAAARSQGVFERIQRMHFAPLVCWTVVAIVAVAAGFLRWTEAMPRGAPPMFAVPLVLAIFCNRPMCAFFSSGPSKWLGRISFPLYLVQFPVLVSFTSGAIVFAAHHGGLTAGAVWLIALSSVAACLLAAMLFEPVEHFTKWFGQRLVDVMAIA